MIRVVLVILRASVIITITIFIAALKYDPWNVVLCLFDLARIGHDQFKLAAPRLVKAEKEIGICAQ